MTTGVRDGLAQHGTDRAPVVGLPRTMVFYYLYPYFRAFFDRLGVELVTSRPTSQRTLDGMTACPTDELCVPVKLTFAHARELKKRGVTHLLIPTLVSIDEGNFCCPKFIGLPTMVAKGVGFDDEHLLRPLFNFREKPDVHYEELAKTARRLGIDDEQLVEAATAEAEERYAEYRALTRDGLTIEEALDRMYGAGGGHRREVYDKRAKYDPELHIGVIGHPYVMYDLLGQRLVDRLREYGHVITPEMVDLADIRAASSAVYQGERMWTFEGEKLGAAFHLMQNSIVDRLVLIGPFGCGPQSVMENFILNEAERQGIPFLHLTVDEQTGEAGIVTRLEAFMDMHRVAGDGTDKKEQQTNPYDMRPAFRGPEPANRKVGTASMGNLNVGLDAMLQLCGVETVPVPPLTQELIDRGRDLSPEFICYPLVGVIGQLAVLLDQGVDLIGMITGKGRCRAGWYGQVQKVLLERAGYDFDMVLIDAPLPLKTNWKPFRDAIQTLTGGVSWLKFIQAIYFGYKKMSYVDQADEIRRELRAYEEKPGTGDRLFNKLRGRIGRASSIWEVNRAMRDFKEAAAEVSRLDIDPLRVQVLGEIYVVLEPGINHNIEKVLASDPRRRVHVIRELTGSAWFSQHVLRNPGLWRRYHEIVDAASPYINQHLGGHGTEDVGLTVMSAEENIDGTVHLVPFTCMPELVAQNLLTHVSRDLDVPVLSLIISEQTGEAGFITRVDAFLDTLIERRRRRSAPLPIVAAG